MQETVTGETSCQSLWNDFPYYKFLQSANSVFDKVNAGYLQTGQKITV